MMEIAAHVLLQALIVGLVLAASVCLWVVISFYATRCTGRPWSLGGAGADCGYGCGCPRKESCIESKKSATETITETEAKKT